VKASRIDSRKLLIDSKRPKTMKSDRFPYRFSHQISVKRVFFQDRDQIQIRANFIIEDKVLVKISINDLL